MANYPLEHERTGLEGRFFMRLDASHEAEMTYRETAPGVIAIEHTIVPEAFRGQNIARDLVVGGVESLAADGKKIVPVCSYVALMFKRNSDWSKWLA